MSSRKTSIGAVPQFKARHGGTRRTGKITFAKAIHTKVANRCKDMLHKVSAVMFTDDGVIFAGDVDSATLVKARMAKSTLDAHWPSLKTILECKSQQACAVF